MKRASQTTSVLALCAGPVLLAAAFSSDDYFPPSPLMTDTAPSPVAYSYDYMPVGDGNDGEEEEEEEPMPMDDKPEGASCSTYDEDVSTRILFTRILFTTVLV